MRTLARGAKVLGAAFLCLNPLTSLFVAGWAQRLSRRRILETWGSEAEPLEAGRLSRLRAVYGEGLRTTFNVWLLSLPGQTLWLFAWYDGWNNSFHKGYEQAWVAPAIGLLGTALFIAAMLYAPLAQARQAGSRDWRRFYDFRVVWAVVRVRWLSCAALAGLYAALSFPLSLLRVAPNFLPFGDPADPRFQGFDATRFLFLYSYAACLVLVPAYLAVRLFAARVYAAGLVEAVRSGEIAEGALAPAERELLGRLGLLRVDPPGSRHILLKALGWAGTRTGRAASIAASAALWFAVVAQVFVAQFLNFRPKVGWLNQPLVHAPWFRHHAWRPDQETP